MVTNHFNKKKLPQSTRDDSSGTGHFAPQPVSESDPNKQTSSRQVTPIVTKQRSTSRSSGVVPTGSFPSKPTTMGEILPYARDRVLGVLAKDASGASIGMEGQEVAGGAPIPISPASSIVQGAAVAARAGQILADARVVTGSGRVAAVAGDIKAATTATAVMEELTIGTLAGTAEEIKLTSTIATNSVTAAKTGSWLGKLAKGATSPQAVAGALLSVIGSYPFAGFIKEESLQTLGFGMNSAIKNNDVEGAEAAVQLQQEILNPDLWDKIKAGVPFLNVIDKLNDFYKAAKLKLSIDEQVIADIKTKIETGETDEEMYNRIAEERAAEKIRQREEDAAYYAEIERQRLDAKAQERADDEAYWANIMARRDHDEVAQESYDQDYWREYYKALQKSRDDSTPSKLNFGLL